MAEPAREIELKFLCAPQDLDRVLAAAPAGEEAEKTLVSVYFDTPEAALAAAQVSLRVRESGGRFVQTLKRGEGVSREEHETPATGPDLDLSMPALRALLPPERLAELAPVSRVRIVRRQRLVRFAGAEIEIAADVGEVAAGGRTEPVSELELELKSGPEAALHDLARELGRAAPLIPSSESKSARGRRLAE